jgi:hypothetical protein
MKIKLSSENVCYYLALNRKSLSLVPENVNIKVLIYKTVVYLVAFCGCEARVTHIKSITQSESVRE